MSKVVEDAIEDKGNCEKAIRELQDEIKTLRAALAETKVQVDEERKAFKNVDSSLGDCGRRLVESEARTAAAEQIARTAIEDGSALVAQRNAAEQALASQTKLLQEVLSAGGELADAAGHAVAEPRRFHQNDDQIQQRLGQEAARFRLLRSRFSTVEGAEDA